MGIPRLFVWWEKDQCSLGPYWGAKLSKDELIGHKVSGRGGEVVVSVDGERVHLSGKVVTILSGKLS